MKKIPTLFRRDPEDMRRVLPEVNAGCEWVIEGVGIATRKYDGTCVMFDGEHWWARREVKPGKQPPADFHPIETDEVTGKTVGWEPAERSGFWKWLEEPSGFASQPGTYELCGPKVNGNPEGFESHVLIKHDRAEVLDAPRSFAELRSWLLNFEGEGIVWHHPDGRMAKLKRRDFSVAPVPEGIEIEDRDG